MVRIRRRGRWSDGETVNRDPQTVEALRQFRAGITGRKGERAVADMLSSIGCPVLHDVTLHDGDGATQIDHLALAPGALLVLETKRYSGLIFGGARDRDWIQRLDNGHETRLYSALRQNERHVRAVRYTLGRLARHLPVRGHIVAAGSAVWCPCLATLVTPIENLPELFSGECQVTGQNGKALRAAWDILQGAIEEKADRNPAVSSDWLNQWM